MFVLKEELGQRIIKKIFSQIDFDRYDKESRYRILSSLYRQFSGDDVVRGMLLDLHSRLIKDKDPFFIVDPGMFISQHLRYGMDWNGGALYFLTTNVQIKEKIERDFESIILDAYRKGHTEDLDPEFVFKLITGVWVSLKDFSGALEHWEETSKKTLYEILFVEKRYFEDVCQLFDQEFRIDHGVKTLSRITMMENVSDLLVFLEKYENNRDELVEILKLIDKEYWELNLSGKGHSEPYNFGARHVDYLSDHRFYNSQLSYMLKLLELKEYFPI